ncbi:Lysine-specific permease [Candidatus Ecksteinia adelgidicola]|nr:Lysine-specific permease [Candidatus Ecksteinia adelgidicola]
MIAIGGSIGTGLFIASGTIVSEAGPIGSFLSYVLISIMVYFLMTSLGELAAFMPVSGSFSTYGSKYIEEGFGVALGWNYWYNWAITIAVDLVASQLVMNYWFPTTPSWIWSVLFLSLIFFLNYISIKGFYKAEYWCSTIKVITVITFISIGILMIFGFLKSGEYSGLKNWTLNKTPFFGSVSLIMHAATIISFSFQGTELIGVAAGESKTPEKNIPHALQQVFWRILLFYNLAIFIIISIVPYTQVGLLGHDIKHEIISPFTLVFQYAGLSSIAALMNGVIIASILSAGNSGMYASTRMLFALASEGKAPYIFSKLSSGGVPRNALYATTIVSALCFLSSMFTNKSVYLWLLHTSAMTGFIAWIGIAISHYRFRRGYIFQGNDLNKLPYRAKYFPFGPIFSFGLCLIITLGQNYHIFLEKKIDWYNIILTYISILLFLIIWFSYKLIHKTHIVKYSEMTFIK